MLAVTPLPAPKRRGWGMHDMNRLAPLLMALMLCFIHEGASATTIMLDPGSVGTAQAEFSLPFSDLNGTGLNGQPISVSLVFDDRKQVQSPPLNNTLYQAVLRLHTDAGQSITSAGGTAYLTDENDAALFPAADVITNGSDVFFAYFLRTSTENGLMHHGVQFDVSLPDIAGKVVDAGWLELKLSPFSRDPLLTVSAPSVPEPASVLLSSLALVVLALVMARRAGSADAPAGQTHGVNSRWPRQARACADPTVLSTAPRYHRSR